MHFFELRDEGAEPFTLKFMNSSLRKKTRKPPRANALTNRLGEAGRKADRQLSGRSSHTASYHGRNDGPSELLYSA